MFTLNLHWEQVAKLEIHDIDYRFHGRNADRVTFKVEFVDEKQYARALEILIRR